MSVLVFLDESKIIDQRERQSIYTLAAVAVEESIIDDFNRKLWKLKQRFFKCQNITDYPLRGRLLLNRKAFDSYRKVEFVGELLSLCRLLKITLFANTKITNLNKNEDDTLFLRPSGTDFESRSGCPLIVADLMEKVSSYMLEEHPGELANLVFSQEQSGQRKHLLKVIMQLYYFTPLGRGLEGILGSPMTMQAALSPGLQSANVFAYIISQFHNGRVKMREFYRELEGLQYISAFDKDEFELRGMNSFRMD